MTDVAEKSDKSPSHGDLGGAVGCDASSTETGNQIDELVTALAARDRFIAVVGHELRNSVAPMVLLAEQLAALANSPQAPATLASRAAMLTRNLHRFVSTVDRVAQVADLRRGKLRLALSTTDLVEVVAEVCRDAQREAAASGIDLAIDAAAPVLGQWDRARVKQIVASLVSNAIRYAGGRIELTVAARGGDAELVVRDHGPGIAPEALPRVFEGFDHLATPRSGGLGVGLWVVKTLCTAMHGSVTAENHPDGGARFCVVLPRG